MVAKVEGSRVLLLRPVRIVGGRKRSRKEEQGEGEGMRWTLGTLCEHLVNTRCSQGRRRRNAVDTGRDRVEVLFVLSLFHS